MLLDLVTVRAGTEMARRYLTRTDSDLWQVNHDQDTGDADEVVLSGFGATPVRTVLACDAWVRDV